MFLQKNLVVLSLKVATESGNGALWFVGDWHTSCYILTCVSSLPRWVGGYKHNLHY